MKDKKKGERKEKVPKWSKAWFLNIMVSQFKLRTRKPLDLTLINSYIITPILMGVHIEEHFSYPHCLIFEIII